MTALLKKYDWKFICLIAGILSAWYDLKTEVQVLKATTELRLTALEKDNEKRTAVLYRPKEAVLPNEIKIERE